MRRAAAFFLFVAMVVLGCAASRAETYEAFFSRLQEEYPPSAKWTEEKYGGRECYAFAREVLNRLFGSYPDNVEWTTHGTISRGFLALKPDEGQPERAAAIVDALRQGDYVRFRTGPDSMHSAVVLSTDEASVHFVDANYDGQNSISWETSVSKSFLAENLAGVYRHLSNGSLPFAASGGIGVLTITYDRAVNIRAQSNGRADLVGIAKPGERFACMGTEPNGWYRIIFPPGVIAYVSPKLATLDPSAAEHPPLPGQAQ